MTGDMSDKLREILTQIQEKTPEAYGVLMSEVNTYGWKCVMGAALLFALAGAGWLGLRSAKKSGRDMGDDSFAFKVMASAIAVLTGLLLGGAAAADAIDCFVTPNLVILGGLGK